MLVEKLGGPPGRYAVASVTLTLIWFAMRLFLDRGDPVSLIFARAGLYGAVWALMLPLFDWLNRKALPADRRPLPLTAEQNRRGALLGLAVGGPFYAGMLVFSLVTGRAWVYPVSFGIILAVVVVIAGARLRSRPPGTRPQPSRDPGRAGLPPY